MSKTIRKKLSSNLTPHYLKKGFELLGFKTNLDASAVQWGGRKTKCDLVIPSESLADLGITIGRDVGIDVKNGEVVLVVEDMDAGAMGDLEAKILPLINLIGENEAAIKQQVMNGTELSLVYDEENEEYGVFLDDEKNINAQNVSVNAGSVYEDQSGSGVFYG